LSGFRGRVTSIPPPRERPLERLNGSQLSTGRLGGDSSLLRSKRRKEPDCDFLWGEHTIIELDEFQHFSTARLRSLDIYRSFRVGFDVTRYRELCQEHRGRADRYRASKQGPDFQREGSRTAQRAYMDAVRDLFAPSIGYTVIRIPAPYEEVEATVQELIAALDVEIGR
jgi:hypothetical protein